METTKQSAASYGQATCSKPKKKCVWSPIKQQLSSETFLRASVSLLLKDQELEYVFWGTRIKKKCVPTALYPLSPHFPCCSSFQHPHCISEVSSRTAASSASPQGSRSQTKLHFLQVTPPFSFHVPFLSSQASMSGLLKYVTQRASNSSSDSCDPWE